MADHRRDRRHRAARRSGASAGSRRGSIAQTTWSASTTPLAVRTPATRPPASTRSSAGVESSTVTPRGSAVAGERVGQRPHPARHGPRAEVLLDVGPHPHPRGHVARVVTLEPASASVASSRSRSSLNAFCASPVQGQPRREQRPGLLARVLGGVRALEPVAAQRLPVVGERVDVGRPLRARPGAERVVDASICAAAAAAGQVEHGARPRSGAGATGSTGTRSSSFSSGRPDLRNRSRSTAGSSVCGRPGVPAEPVLLDEAERAADARRRPRAG